MCHVISFLVEILITDLSRRKRLKADKIFDVTSGFLDFLPETFIGLRPAVGKHFTT